MNDIEFDPLSNISILILINEKNIVEKRDSINGDQYFFHQKLIKQN